MTLFYTDARKWFLSNFEVNAESKTAFVLGEGKIISASSF